MNWTLEVVNIPVTDLDRARDFYAQGCGFQVDVDTEVAPGVRIVQLTPPGSRCSIALSSGMPPAPGTSATPPGSLHGLQLCVTDIEAAHAELLSRGVPAGPVQHLGPTGWTEGKGDQTWNSFLTFKDPDGNGWTVQEVPSELSER
ncbi:VOC family protein [Streptomyces sp. NPDC047097]|uniref:VOC family protein n=1 Tax=Streptomyces sp. NPDC047097 TaxID=3155260 RepID=UPI0033E20A69